MARSSGSLSTSVLAEAFRADRLKSALDAYAEAVLDATLAQVLEFGLRRTTAEEIAQRAGVNRATIYRRFVDREGLVVALLRRETQRHFDRLAAEVAASTDPFAWIVEGFLYGVTAATSDPLLRRLMSTDPAFAAPLVSMSGPVMAIAVAFSRDRIKVLQDRGEAAAGDPGALAEAGMRIVHSLVLDPAGVLPTGDAALRAFARRALIPMITGCGGVA